MISRRRTAFWRLWTAQAISVLGDGMHRAALLWWAIDTRSAAAAAVLAVSASVPLVLCSPVGGALADRWSRRRLMAGADVLRAGTSVALALAVAAGGSLAVVAACTALAAVGEAVFAPAYSASLTQVLPEAERTAGNALQLANGAAGGVLGPAFGGVVVALAGVGWVLVLDALTFAVSAVLIGTASFRAPTRTAPAGAAAGVRERERGGWRLVSRHPEIRRLATLAAVLNFFVAPVTVLVVALVRERLAGGPTLYGVMEACIAGGVLAGAAVAPALGRSAGPERPLVGGLLGLGAALAAVGLTGHAVVVGATFVAMGAGVAIANTFLLGRLQTVVAEDAQGRVFGVVGGVANGLRPIGLAAGAPLAVALGPAIGCAVCGLGVVVATVAVVRRPAAVASVAG